MRLQRLIVINAIAALTMVLMVALTLPPVEMPHAKSPGVAAPGLSL